MNNLSWFIYLTQATESGAVLFFAVGIGVLAWGGMRFAYACAASDSASYEHDDRLARAAAKNQKFAELKPNATRVIAACLVCFFIAAAMPSRQTMLLIAGSELGERIVKSDAVKDIVNPGADLLKAWIKDETDKITGKKK